MAFRQLQQMVPEFDKFTNDHAAPIPGMPANLAADLTGARIVGRWKSVSPSLRYKYYLRVTDILFLLRVLRLI